MKPGNSGKISKSSVFIIVLILAASAAGYFNYFSSTSHESSEYQIDDNQNTTSQAVEAKKNDEAESKIAVNNVPYNETNTPEENLSTSKPLQKNRNVAAESDAPVIQEEETSPPESTSLKSVETKTVAPTKEKKILAVATTEKTPVNDPQPQVTKEQPQKLINEPIPAKTIQEAKMLEKVVQPTTIAIEQPKESKSQVVVVPEHPKPNLIEQNFEKLKTPEFWFWLGVGENYQYHQQTIPSISGQSKFQNIQGPTLLITSGMMGQQMGAEVSYKETPGRMDSSTTVTVKDGSFVWKTFTGEGLYRLENSNSYIRGGLQQHSIPFMDLDTTNSTLTVRSNSMTMATLGYEKKYPVSKKLRGEWMIRYQYPILVGTSSGNNFTVKPEFAFDGSIGGIYQYNESFRFGLFWYGQWHQYNFKYGPLDSTSFSGRQTLFYSNVDLRLGWEF